jgi:hypothetical protein
VVLQEEALGALERVPARARTKKNGLHVIDAFAVEKVGEVYPGLQFGQIGFRLRIGFLGRAAILRIRNRFALTETISPKAEAIGFGRAGIRECFRSGTDRHL